MGSSADGAEAPNRVFALRVTIGSSAWSAEAPKGLLHISARGTRADSYYGAPIEESLEKKRRNLPLPLSSPVAARVRRSLPRVSARPCPAAASRSSCRHSKKNRKGPTAPIQEQEMTHSRTEIDELRAAVSCAAVLEKASPAWRLDRAESSRHCLKYRRGAGEIVIVNHNGAGWWDPNSDAKGDVFNLVQHLEPRLNFGEVRKALRPLAGVQPVFVLRERTRTSYTADMPIAERWARKPRLRRHSKAWLYLASRGLPEAVLLAAARCDVIREGPHGSAWFAHRTGGVVTHVDVRGPTYKGSLTGGSKSLFWFPRDARVRSRFVLAEAAIDALSRAALERMRDDTAYAATGGAMGPGAIAAIRDHLLLIAAMPGALFESATDANGAGDRYAERHEQFANEARIPFMRRRPPLDGQDWNDVLKARALRRET
jgi:hypothetical protein